MSIDASRAARIRVRRRCVAKDQRELVRQRIGIGRFHRPLRLERLERLALRLVLGLALTHGQQAQVRGTRAGKVQVRPQGGNREGQQQHDGDDLQLDQVEPNQEELGGGQKDEEPFAGRRPHEALAAVLLAGEPST